VERTRDAKDERQVRITLTAKGRELHGPVKQAWDQVVCAVGLPQTELEALKAQIHTLRETLDEGLTGPDLAGPAKKKAA
jgi:DNA-binding MarR family transcriptional regulator